MKSSDKIAPGFEMSVLARDDAIIPLFGQSIFAWSRDDFREFTAVMKGCAKAASKRRDRTTRDSLQQVMKRVTFAQRPLANLIQAREKSEAAVQSLVNAEVSKDTVALLDLAEEALQGTEIRPKLRGMSRDSQQPLIDLLHAQRSLPLSDKESYSSLLAAHKESIQQARLAEQEKAAAALETALEEVNGVSEDEAGLSRLNELSQLAEIAQATPEKARQYRETVAMKRQAIQQKLDQAEEARRDQLIETMVEKLKDYPVNEPSDLGKLWDEGVAMGNELRAQGERRSKNAMSLAFWERFNKAVVAMLEPFKKQLEQIPVSQAGVDQLKGAVATMTGIKQNMPVMRPYHQAVQSRGTEIVGEMRQIACNKTLDAAGLSSSEAEQPLWGAGNAMTLGEFVCAITDKGSTVHEYDDAGFMSDTHTLKLTTQHDGFHTLKLHEGEVQPGKKMLIGFELSDANQQRPLSVSDWEQYVAVNMQGGGGSADCERLANKPRNELSMAETERILGCIMSRIPAMIEQQERR
ncbi:MAG: hypothetical protein OQK68_04870 [Sedimenticola sp.]|nr:hypothetical protein [Sedimenticola sp.]MCW8945985.1 hypothetical protein [Sedimenticola sp.]